MDFKALLRQEYFQKSSCFMTKVNFDATSRLLSGRLLLSSETKDLMIIYQLLLY